jgi:hypothetical protein
VLQRKSEKIHVDIYNYVYMVALSVVTHLKWNWLLVFTGGDYGPREARHIRKALNTQGIKSSFFFTGDFLSETLSLYLLNQEPCELMAITLVPTLINTCCIAIGRTGTACL